MPCLIKGSWDHSGPGLRHLLEWPVFNNLWNQLESMWFYCLFYVWCCWCGMLLCVYPVCAPLGVSPVSQAWKFVPPLQAVASVPREEAKQMALPDLDDAGQTHKQSQHQRSSSVGPLTRSNSVVRNQLTYIICYMSLIRLIFYIMSMISRNLGLSMSFYDVLCR